MSAILLDDLENCSFELSVINSLLSLIYFNFSPSMLIFIHKFVLFYFIPSLLSSLYFPFSVSLCSPLLSVFLLIVFVFLCLTPLPVAAAPNLLSRAHAPLKPPTQYPFCLALHEPLSEDDWVRRNEVTHS